MLARAGVIKGVNATCYSNGPTISYLKSSGAHYVDKAVVVSGNIVTGNGPDAAKEFAQQVLAVLRG